MAPDPDAGPGEDPDAGDPTPGADVQESGGETSGETPSTDTGTSTGGTTSGTSSTEEDDGGCSTATSSPGQLAGLAIFLLALMALRRRRTGDAAG